jgi:hypothetical protein
MLKIVFLPLLECLLLTVVVESLLGYLLGIKDKKELEIVILINIVTNALLNAFVIYMDNFQIVYSAATRRYFVPILEILVIYIEGAVYRRMLPKKKINPFILSFILNACSYLLGLFIFGGLE